MKRLFPWLLPVAVLFVSATMGLYLIRTTPAAKRTPPKSTPPVVEVLKAQPVDYTIMVESRGTISPRTQGTLVAEVAGRILETSEHFRPGGFFDAGHLLVRIDPTDYQHALTIAQSERLQAQLTLKEEKAKGTQARRDWKKMGLGGRPGDLTLRTPQRGRAQAALAAAEARWAQAKRNLQHTKIGAPYAGRVLDQQVARGQYVAKGTPLATVYAVDYAEIRIPITDRQATFLALPEHFREDASRLSGPAVTLAATIGGQAHTWQGKVVRTEGAIDPRTRQLHVVAQVEDPYGRGPQGRPPLKVGQFVRASIQGRHLTHVFLVPRIAFRNTKEVLTLSPENRIQRRPLQAIWRNADNLIVQEGLQPGERIVLTPLPYAPEGMTVKVSTPSSPENNQRQR